MRVVLSVSRLKIRIVPSLLAAYSRPCGSNAIRVRDAVPGGISESPIGAGCSRSVTSHNWTLPSSPPDANVFPSGLNAT
jgi:hypothetical protein